MLDERDSCFHGLTNRPALKSKKFPLSAINLDGFEVSQRRHSRASRDKEHILKITRLLTIT